MVLNGHNFTMNLSEEICSPVSGARIKRVSEVLQSLKFCLAVGMAACLAGCGATHSPDIYASSAVQQANKVDAGIVIGFREVMISANGTTGAVTGGAAGGVLGTQVGGSTFDQALGGVAGTAIGSVLGSTIEHVTGDTKGWEYIVKKNNGDLVSVTQVEKKPLELGQKVLVIAGTQARIVPDYSVDIPVAKPAVLEIKDEKKPAPKPVVEEPVSSAIVPPVEKPAVADLPPLSPLQGAATELPDALPALPAVLSPE
jgi:outer membrane lipoprotein SlyB